MRNVATALALAGWVALAVGLLRVLAIEKSVVPAGPGFWALCVLALAPCIVHGTRRNSSAYLWIVLGAVSGAVFFGPLAHTGVLLLIGAGVVHLAVVRARWPTLLAPCWWVLGLAAQFVATDFVSRALTERGGGHLTSAPVAVVGRWVLGAALLWIGLRYLPQSIGARGARSNGTRS